MKIAVVSFACEPKNEIFSYPSTQTEIASICFPNKSKYCDLHGYDFITTDEQMDDHAQPNWTKFLLILKHINKYDWMFWTDADSIFMRSDIKLEQFIDDSKHFVFSFGSRGKAEPINSGHFFVKNSDYAKRLLQKAYSLNKSVPVPGASDQIALQRILRKMPSDEKQENIKFFHQREFNAYEKNYKKGDFIVHMVGINEKCVESAKKWLSLCDEKLS